MDSTLASICLLQSFSFLNSMNFQSTWLCSSFLEVFWHGRLPPFYNFLLMCPSIFSYRLQIFTPHGLTESLACVIGPLFSLHRSFHRLHRSQNAFCLAPSQFLKCVISSLSKPPPQHIPGSSREMHRDVGLSQAFRNHQQNTAQVLQD